jgi:hypothetical protein
MQISIFFVSKSRQIIDDPVISGLTIYQII